MRPRGAAGDDVDADVDPTRRSAAATSAESAIDTPWCTSYRSCSGVGVGLGLGVGLGVGIGVGLRLRPGIGVGLVRTPTLALAVALAPALTLTVFVRMFAAEMSMGARGASV